MLGEECRRNSVTSDFHGSTLRQEAYTSKSRSLTYQVSVVRQIWIMRCSQNRFFDASRTLKWSSKHFDQKSSHMITYKLIQYTCSQCFLRGLLCSFRILLGNDMLVRRSCFGAVLLRSHRRLFSACQFSFTSVGVPQGHIPFREASNTSISFSEPLEKGKRVPDGRIVKEPTEAGPKRRTVSDLPLVRFQ